MRTFLIGAALLSAPTDEILPTTPAPKLVRQDWHDYYMSLVPDGVFTPAEKSRLVFYSKKDMPQVYQQEGSFHAIAYNISADPNEPFGNTNREFPWKTGGLDDSPNGGDFKAILLPEPMRVRRRLLPLGFINENPAWQVGRYPVGTKVIEFLTVDGTVFEVRILEKVKDTDGYTIGDAWRPRWFRALRNRRQLEEVVKGTDYAEKLRIHLEKPMPRERLRNRHPATVIDETRPVEKLPAMPKELQEKINARPFQEVTDVAWAAQDGEETYAPSGGFVADNFTGGFFKSGTCINCHQTVLRHAQTFQSRDWYGRVRGTDGIFSIPPMPSGELARQKIVVSD